MRPGASSPLESAVSISIHAPAWGATAFYFNKIIPDTYFNPRTRVGCDWATRCRTGSHAPISIHAPAWGATFLQEEDILCRRNFNPRQAREIVRRFNYIYGETLVEPEILLPDNAACLRLPGTDGKAKMSKSLGNCIYLSEEPEEIQKKIMSMYTDPGHLRVQDPGKIEGNTVFTYLDAFCLPEHFERYLPDYPNLAELKAHYQRGGLGDVKVKRFLNSIMQEILEPIRNRRKEFSKDIPAIYDMLQQGCEVARAAAAETLADVKKAMKINYFDDKELIEEQVKRFSQE